MSYELFAILEKGADAEIELLRRLEASSLWIKIEKNAFSFTDSSVHHTRDYDVAIKLSEKLVAIDLIIKTRAIYGAFIFCFSDIACCFIDDLDAETSLASVFKSFAD